MATPRTVQVGPLGAASANGYALSQAGTAGTPLTLNGSITGGVADAPRRLIITSAGNDSGITFKIIGRQIANGPTVTEILPGANVGAAQSALDYAQVISITPSANTAANVTAGTNGVASSSWIRLDTYGYAPISLEAIVTGTVNYTVEAADRDPNIVVDTSLVTPNTGPAPITPAQMVWQAHPTLQAMTGNGFDSYSAVPTWVRCTLNSGTGNVVFTASQPVSGLRL